MAVGVDIHPRTGKTLTNRTGSYCGPVNLAEEDFDLPGEEDTDTDMDIAKGVAVQGPENDRVEGIVDADNLTARNGWNTGQVEVGGKSKGKYMEVVQCNYCKGAVDMDPRQLDIEVEAEVDTYMDNQSYCNSPLLLHTRFNHTNKYVRFEVLLILEK